VEAEVEEAEKWRKRIPILIRNTSAHSIAEVVDVVIDIGLPSLFSLNQLLGLGLGF